MSGGHEIYWEVRGHPAGKPAVVLHGGPGSGCPPSWAGFFDLGGYRVVLFDQRGCGRSRPHAGAPRVDLSDNATQHLIADIERLREHLGIERWLVLGASWGSVLGLAYAQAHPERVTEMVLFSVGTGTRGEVEWITRGVGRYFPSEWRRFRDGVPEPDRDGDLVAAYNRLLLDPDPAIHEQAAQDWCAWEATHMGPDRRYDDPVFRLCFARLVTHYWSHDHFLEEGQIVRHLDRLADIPGVLVHGRLDISGPLEVPWTIAQRWGELVVVEQEGHVGGPATAAAVTAALSRFLG